jgi:hypothetical protein
LSGIPAARETAETGAATQMSDHDMEEIEVLLREFSEHPPKEVHRTLLEMAQVNRKELPCSNVLAFFFDPNGAHGLGDLFLRAFLKAADSELKDNDLSSARAYREAPTDKTGTDERKYLDLVVVGEDFLIGIENKLFASARGNPYRSYSKRLKDSVAGIPGVTIEKYLLGLVPHLDGLGDGSEPGFKPVTYSGFFAVLEKDLSGCSGHASQVAALNDFITTIKRLKSGYTMDEQCFELIRRYRVGFSRLLPQLELLKLETKEKVKNLTDGVPADGFRMWSGCYHGTAYNGRQCEYFEYVVYEIAVVGDLKVQAWLKLFPTTGWRICLWTNKETKHREARAWLERSGIKFEIDDEYGEWIYEKKREISEEEDTKKGLVKLLNELKQGAQRQEMDSKTRTAA